MGNLYIKIATVIIIFIFLGTSIIPVSGGFISKKAQVDTKIDPIGNSLFDRYMKLLMKMGHMPSLTVCIVKNDGVVFTKAYGVANRENDIPATENTIYLVHSISKVITATALMQLYDKGYLDLDDNVSEYLPFDLKNPYFSDVNITFRMLLAHESSLLDGMFLPINIPGDPDIPTNELPYLKEYLLPNGSLYGPDIWSKEDPPGSACHYSNIGPGVIGYLVECISHQPFEEYCKENLFEPLGMYDTSFRLKDFDSSRLAVNYEFYSGIYYRLAHYGWMPRPCGNVRTTIKDLSHFLIAHMNGGVYNGTRILNESTVEMMHTVQYPGHAAVSKPLCHINLGLGFWVKYQNKFKEPLIGHSGHQQTNMFFRKSDKTGFISFSNACSDNFYWDGSQSSRITNQINILAHFLVQELLLRKASKF